jgi:hypothetical protein
MSYEDDMEENYDPDMYEEFGEGFENEFDAVSEASYEKAFDKAIAAEKGLDVDETSAEYLKDEQVNEDEFEFDEVVGGRDRKPVMSLLNKGKLDKYELDDLLNKLE